MGQGGGRTCVSLLGRHRYELDDGDRRHRRCCARGCELLLLLLGYISSTTRDIYIFSILRIRPYSLYLTNILNTYLAQPPV